MNYAITLYSISGNSLRIFNGYSFFDDYLKENDYLHVFIPSNFHTNYVFNDSDNVFLSLFFTSQYARVKSIITDKFTLGGPLMDFIQETRCRVITGPFERAFGLDISSNFSFYFEDFIKKMLSSNEKIKNVVFSFSIANGCYYGDCLFCYSKYVSRYNRPGSIEVLAELANVGGRLSSIDSKIYIFTCQDSVPGPTLEKAFTSLNLPENIFVEFFIRPDLDVSIFQDRDLSQYVFLIGLEALSQTIVDTLQKGYDVVKGLELIEEIIKHNGTAEITLLNDFPFLSNEMLSEHIDNLRTLRRIATKYNARNRIRVRIYEKIRWFDGVIPSRFFYPVKQVSPNEFYIDYSSNKQVVELNNRMYRETISSPLLILNIQNAGMYEE